MAKQYLVPGMRVGWLMFYGEGLDALKGGVKNLSQVVLGACHLAQQASSVALDDGCVEFKKVTFYNRLLKGLQCNVDKY